LISEPVNVTDASFEKAVINSPLPTIVDFWAPWCQPCKMVSPLIEKVARENAGKLLVAKLNTDENQLWAQKYNVSGIPTIFFFWNGKIVYRHTGLLSEANLKMIVGEFLNIAAQSK
jgi:thioredoxin 1